MRIKELEIRNFRALESLHLVQLTDFVVIAGANGSGKTTILDALRLVKSSYVSEEYTQWFGEFGIRANRPFDIRRILRDPARNAFVRAEFELDPTEIEFLSRRVKQILASIEYQRVKRERSTVTGNAPLFSADFGSAQREALYERVSVSAEAAQTQLARGGIFTAQIDISAEPQILATPDPLATAALTCFAPGHLGEMDFHTSERTYNRQGEGRINVRLGIAEDESPSRFLYGLQNKYQNLKTRLSEELVRARLLGDVDGSESLPLESSIKDLFTAFFPEKRFCGIEVDEDSGDLKFDVEVATGERHDIDELSSGEKEIVYGYLWLRTATPKHSIVLIDEPELHLNPALVQGLPEFYKTHLSEALGAQVWIVTHSDAILRTAARSAGMKVFHVARATGDDANQATAIGTGDAVETAVIDLIGDLAAYRPNATIVLLEGSSDTRFDVDVVRRLFPELAERANFIPAGDRSITERSTERLLKILVEAGLSARAVSICDGDVDRGADGRSRFYWPVYEIENFLLEPSIIRGACLTLLRDDPFESDDAVMERFRRLATGELDRLAAVILQRKLNREVVSAISIGFSGEDPTSTLAASAAGSVERVSKVDVSLDRIRDEVGRIGEELRAALESNAFLARFPGDRLLHLFAGEIGVNAESFKNVALDQARASGVRPRGMEATLMKALGAATA